MYYVGDANEVRENFLGEKTSPYAPVKWPMGAKGSFALNGNHEMYADGNGYWRVVLPKMGLKERGSEWGAGQWASFFCLENKHWRIIGLDTGYNSTRFEWDKVPVLQRSQWLRKTTSFKPGCTMPEPLLAWLKSSVNPDGDKRGLILLSHHGPHSAFEGWYQIPAKQLAKLIHRPVIWFWGHEHRLAIYVSAAVKKGAIMAGEKGPAVWLRSDHFCWSCGPAVALGFSVASWCQFPLLVDIGHAGPRLTFPRGLVTTGRIAARDRPSPLKVTSFETSSIFTPAPVGLC